MRFTRTAYIEDMWATPKRDRDSTSFTLPHSRGGTGKLRNPYGLAHRGHLSTPVIPQACRSVTSLANLDEGLQASFTPAVVNALKCKVRAPPAMANQPRFNVGCAETHGAYL
jgi:hypothetical protein